MERTYLQSQHNAELYSKYRINSDEFWESEKYFFNLNGWYMPGMSMLDVGGQEVWEML